MTAHLIKKARFDAKIDLNLKEEFERAAEIGGYRTLTDFIIKATKEKSDAILREHSRVLKSDRDAKFFFQTIINPPKPNEALVSAIGDYIGNKDERRLHNRTPVQGP